MKYEQQIQTLLDEHGAVLTRTKRHNVYKFPDGKTFVMSQSPSDWRSAMEQLKDLRNLLGVQDPERGKEGDRRPRKTAKPPERKPRIHAAPANTALADQLRLSGCEANALRERIDTLQNKVVGLLAFRDALIVQNANLEAQRDALSAKRRACWMCRLRDWWEKR